jgi:outer membrane receptor for ferrienterochelin and colicin
MRATKPFVLVLFCMLPFFMQGQLTISGYVFDQDGEALITAHVFDTISKQGVSTNTYGFYTLPIAKGKKAVLRFSFVGYKDAVYSVEGVEEKEISVMMKPFLMNEVVVSAAAQLHSDVKNGAIHMPVQQIERMPVLLGETDVLKALTLLPGVSGGTEGTSNIFVRGGTPDQNLILLDGAPVYNVNHLFGFLSLFNTDAIKKVELFKSEFPARYGGRLSSVLDISMKEGGREKINKKLSIGVVSSRFMIDGPIGKSKRTTFLLSARSSYLYLLTLPKRIGFSSGGSDFFNYNLYDLNAKISHQIHPKHRVFLSFYSGNDRFTDNYRDVGGTEKFGLQWGNQTMTFRSASQLGQKAFLNTSVIYSRYRYTQFNDYKRTTPDIAKQFYSGSSGLSSFTLRQTLEYSPWPSHHIIGGIETTAFRFVPQSNELQATGQPTFTFVRKLNANAFNLFLEDNFKISSFWKWHLGVRWNQYRIEGRTYRFLEPRIASRVRLIWGIEWTQSFSRMNQPIHLLTNSGIGLPNDIWVPATANTPPQTARQWGSGLSKYFDDWGIEATIEYYQKYTKNLIDYRQGRSFLETLDEDWEAVIERNGEGWSEGIELLLHKQTGRLNGMIAYTLSRHERQFERINNGERFPFQFDRRHDIASSFNYQIDEHWNIAFTWVYHTGNAVTLPTEKYPVPEELATYVGGYVFTYDQRNGYRLPAYHRADIGVANTKPKGEFGSREWRFGIYNLYNRKNTYYIQSTNVAIYEPGTLNVIGWDTQLRNRYLLPIMPYVSFTRSW